MDDTFKIYVHRLKEGRSEKIVESLSPEFLDINEAELVFKELVFIDGTAEMTDGTLVLNFSIKAQALMPCAVCNRQCAVNIEIEQFCHTVELCDIKGSVYDYREVLRESILLEVPYTTECEGGCSERESMAKYLGTS